jgi:hypothetical protein
MEVPTRQQTCGDSKIYQQDCERILYLDFRLSYGRPRACKRQVAAVSSIRSAELTVLQEYPSLAKAGRAEKRSQLANNGKMKHITNSLVDTDPVDP